MVSSIGAALNDGHAALGLVHYAVMSEFTEKEGDRMAVRDEHLAYQNQLETEGKLFCAGPLLKEDGEMAGIGLIIYKAASLEEAIKSPITIRFTKAVCGPTKSGRGRSMKAGSI